MRASGGRPQPLAKSILSASQIHVAAVHILASGAFANGAPMEQVDNLTLEAMRAYMPLSGRAPALSRPRAVPAQPYPRV